jgi:hypothetical protein
METPLVVPASIFARKVESPAFQASEDLNITNFKAPRSRATQPHLIKAFRIEKQHVSMLKADITDLSYEFVRHGCEDSDGIMKKAADLVAIKWIFGYNMPLLIQEEFEKQLFNIVRAKARHPQTRQNL